MACGEQHCRRKKSNFDTSTNETQGGYLCAAGKTSLAQAVAGLAGQELVEVALTSSTDTSDLLGGFEQLEPRRQLQVTSLHSLSVFHSTADVQCPRNI